MADTPWLTIVGLGEDGPDGLPPASQRALAGAEVVMGPERHLDLLPETGAERIVWPVPFARGLPLLKDLKGRPTVVLASGDPFWFGAGSVLARALEPGEWTALPGPSCFSLAAARLGWPLDKTACLGLHAAPLGRLRPLLAPGRRAIVTLRDGDSVHELARYLGEAGFGDTDMSVFEALGGPREARTDARACDIAGNFRHPVCVALSIAGSGHALPRVSGIDDRFFESDGVMTKRPVRALTLSALAPLAGDYLWDIGGGSGSVAIEWLLADPATRATSVEARADRADLIRRNAAELGVDRLDVVEGKAPEALSGLDRPDAVFIGGGLSAQLLEHLTDVLAPGTRIVSNAVTLESEALLIAWHQRLGGDLLRVDMSRANPLGSGRAWKAVYPVVQWSVTL